MTVYYQGDDIVLPFILEDEDRNAIDTANYQDLWMTIYRCQGHDLVEVCKFSKVPNHPTFRDMTMIAPTTSGEFECYIPRSLTKDFHPGTVYVGQLDRWQASGFAEAAKRRRIISDMELFKIIKSINPNA